MALAASGSDTRSDTRSDNVPDFYGAAAMRPAIPAKPRGRALGIEVLAPLEARGRADFDHGFPGAVNSGRGKRISSKYYS